MKFHLIAVPGILALLCSWSLAVAVLLTGPGLRRDRLLALLLFVEGTAWGSGAGLLYLMESPQVAWYVQAVFVSMLLAMPGCVLAFVGTLPTPLVAPLNSRVGLIAIAVLTAATELFSSRNRTDSSALSFQPGTRHGMRTCQTSRSTSSIWSA